ncbi:MAG: linalool dehydratase/isomerase domain-containing protein [Solirubrobacteraceae bacterium]
MSVTHTPPEQDVATPAPALRLPEHEAPLGPVTARLQRRWVTGYLALWAASLFTLAASKSPARRTLAAGMLVPGGGYAYQGRKGRAAGTALGALLGFVMWVLLGMMFLPFTVWGVGAWLAARGAKKHPRKAGLPVALLTTGPLLLAGTALARQIGFRRSKQVAAQRNEHLAAHVYVPPSAAGAIPGRGELTTEQLQLQRFLLDRALQPVDRFGGFEWLDQFREAAVRYQLNYAQWAIALAQYRCTPAFQGYVNDAQRRLILKMTERRVWQYWKWENLWGNFSLDQDPIARDNIMFSGYLGLMIAMYENSTGDRCFDAKDSLRFRWSARKSFDYDDESLAQTLFTNFDESSYCMFPCEPNWVYEACNLISFAGLVGHDRVHGTTYADRLRSRFRDAVDFEFAKPDGSPITIRASRAGIAIPGMAASTASEASSVFFLSPGAHDIATRLWLIVRDHVVGGESGPVFQSPVIDRMDVGNYKPGWGAVTYAFSLASATEMGDAEAVDAVRASLERVAPKQVKDGVASYPGSVMATMMLAPGELGGERAFHDLLAYGIPVQQRDWPRLVGAPYPDVLVAKAVSDGHALELVLEPGGAEDRVRLDFDQLTPGRSYAVTAPGGSRMLADEEGHACTTIELPRRLSITVSPET